MNRKTIVAFCVFFFVTTFLSCIVVEASEGNCAHVSLARCLSIELGRKVQAAELIPFFPPSYRGDSPVPAHLLVDVAARMGVSLSFETLDPKNPTAMWESSVLLLFAKTEQAHYVLCKNVEKDRVVIVDSLSELEERHLSIRHLSAIWDGTALVVSKRNFWRVLETFLLSAIYAISAIGIGSFLVKKVNKLKSVAGIAAIASLSGCESRMSSLPTLHFEQSVVTLRHSVVEGQTFPLKLTLKRASYAANSASVQTITSTCKCLSIRQEDWPTLKPGESLQLSVEVNSAGKDAFAGDIVVETKDGEVASANISGIVTTQFRPSSKAIVHSFDLSGINEGEFTVTRRKEKGFPISRPKTTTAEAEGVVFTFVDANDVDIGMSPVGGDHVKEVHRWMYRVEKGTKSCEVPLPYENVSIEFGIHGL